MCVRTIPRHQSVNFDNDVINGLSHTPRHTQCPQNSIKLRKYNRREKNQTWAMFFVWALIITNEFICPFDGKGIVQINQNYGSTYPDTPTIRHSHVHKFIYEIKK